MEVLTLTVVFSKLTQGQRAGAYGEAFYKPNNINPLLSKPHLHKAYPSRFQYKVPILHSYRNALPTCDRTHRIYRDSFL